MRVIAFSLLLSHPSLKVSRELSKKDTFHPLFFPAFVPGERHVSPDFSEVSWKGYSVQLVCSVRTPPRIASLRLDKYVCSRRSSISPVLTGGRGLPRRHTSTQSLVCVPMLYLTTWPTFFVGSVVLFGVTSLGLPITWRTLGILLHGMGLE